ncbi:hypothetical protein A8A54_04150 [Brucella pseudogrignonensis]|uniref:hypothetical protein n=1 Tax=Brucella pseudogrignonensis TaxID=419475 RepID=UPI0007DA8FE3|nr:hypothetical protein [Brucella pseudogrignonensis]ANG95754.1 hypothetical protein A8A54_04150 [Brucella pseudogrignonensis]
MESKAIGMFGIRSKVLGFGAVTVALCFGVGIYLNTDGGNSDKPQNSKLASLLKGSSAMQPLPEMPSEPMPNISAQQELLIPDNAPNVQGIDPIITGPRAYKPRAEIKRTASKDS